MTDTPSFEPKFWNGTHELSAQQDALSAKLVPTFGEAATPHGEILRCVTRVYYDLYNNGLCNGPFVDEVAVLQEHSAILTARMARPEKLGNLLNAVAPPGAEWGDTRVKDSSAWRYAPALEDLMAAAVKYAEECETSLAAQQSAGLAASA